MNIGQRIKERRKFLGLTQEDLAKKVNKSSQVVSNWERGYTSTINHDDIVNICKALLCSADYLLGLTDIAKPTEKGKPIEDDDILNTKIAANMEGIYGEKPSPELVTLIREVLRDELNNKEKK